MKFLILVMFLVSCASHEPDALRPRSGKTFKPEITKDANPDSDAD
jgi:hypothetical protein